MRLTVFSATFFAFFLVLAGCGGGGAAAVKPAEQPGEKVTSDQSPVTSEKKTEETAEKPAEQPAEKPAEETAEAPAEEPAEKPAEEAVAEAPEEAPEEEIAETAVAMPAKEVKEWRTYTWPAFDMDKIGIALENCVARDGGGSGKQLAENINAELQNILLATGRYTLFQGTSAKSCSVRSEIVSFTMSPNRKRWEADVKVMITRPGGKRSITKNINAEGFSTESPEQAAERAAADAVLQMLVAISGN